MQTCGWVSIVVCIALVLIALAVIVLFFVKICRDPMYGWSDIVMYGILLLFAIVVVVLEARNGTLVLDMSISSNSATLNDSCDVIMQKTQNLTDYMSILVSWRISFIVATIAAIFVWAFVMMRIPKWQIFYLTLLMVFVIVYGFMSYYSFHLGGRTSMVVSGNLNTFWRKCTVAPIR